MARVRDSRIYRADAATEADARRSGEEPPMVTSAAPPCFEAFSGAGAHGLGVSRDTTDLCVTNRLDSSGPVISRTCRVVSTRHVGGSPDMLQVTPDGGQLWV